MIADLSMYDWPAMRAETDAFWDRVRNALEASGVAAPKRLARNPKVEASWADPDLLIGQTCGMPFVCGQCGDARVFARPDYGLADARDGFYRSVILVRADDAAAGPEAVLAQRGRRVAVNEWRSFSGHIALRAYLARLRAGATEPFFGAAVLSGRHAESAAMVARGDADVAALDSVAWALLCEHETAIARRLAVLDVTLEAPALPFITAPAHFGRRADLASALDGAALATPPTPGLPRRVIAASEADYDATRRVARIAAAEPFAPGAPAVPAV